MFKRHLITIMNKKILIIGSTGFVGKKLNLYLKIRTTMFSVSLKVQGSIYLIKNILRKN